MSGEEMDQLTDGLKALAADLRRVEAPVRVEERLVAAFRERQAQPIPPAMRPRRSWWVPVAAWATAAAAGTALTVFLTREHPPVPVHQRARSAMQLAVAEPAADPEVISIDDSAGPPASPLLAGWGEDSGFIPLPNAESISPNEEVDVVRVEVPRSAIVALGLPVSEEAATEKVTADIALGSDGLARAVRILDE